MSKLNPWLAGKLAVKDPPSLNLLLQVQPSALEEVQKQVSGISGVTVGRNAYGYLEVTAPQSLVPALQKVPGVTSVNYNMPRYPYALANILPGPQFTYDDPLLGTIRISAVEVPGVPVYSLATAPLTPLAVLANMFSVTGLEMNQIRAPGVTILPSTEARRVIGMPDPPPDILTKVCVLDTGSPFQFHPAWRKSITMKSFVPEPPTDGLGHGTWCTTAAFGSRLPTRFGPIDGVVHGKNVAHGKVLTTPGFGSDMDILKGIEWAVNEYGAKIISMSLGGDLQGGVTQDPLCVVIEKLKNDVIFCCAGGNSGPDDYTIGSPGASPHALTVAAYSMIAEETATFSSRGPQAAWYQGNTDQYDKDRETYGDNFLKPDCEAPGGSGDNQANGQTEEIYSGVQGWVDGMGDLTPGDWVDSMRGTSMATPMVAGLVSYLYEVGIVRTTDDVKKYLRKTYISRQPKSKINGYGLINLGRFA